MITFPLILKWTNVSFLQSRSFVRYFTFHFLILKTSLNCDLSTSENWNEISIHLLKLFIFISVAISVWIRLCTGVLTIIAQFYLFKAKMPYKWNKVLFCITQFYKRIYTTRRFMKWDRWGFSSSGLTKCIIFMHWQ